jgi:hypothetical protein
MMPVKVHLVVSGFKTLCYNGFTVLNYNETYASNHDSGLDLGIHIST